MMTGWFVNFFTFKGISPFIKKIKLASLERRESKSFFIYIFKKTISSLEKKIGIPKNCFPFNRYYRKYVFSDVRKSVMGIKRVNSMVSEEMVSNLDVNDVASPLQSVVKERVKMIFRYFLKKPNMEIYINWISNYL